MLRRWRAAGLLWPTIMTLIALPILIALGTWQWRRLEWKENLITQIEARRTIDPIPVEDALAQAAPEGGIDYLRVRATGKFDHGNERHVYAPRAVGSGWHVYTPLVRADGGQSVMINRGWVPDSLKDPALRPDGQIAGVTTVVGLARSPEVKGLFTPDNDVAANRWYSRDLPGMASSFGAGAAAFAPFAIDVEREPENPGGWPKGGVTEVRLSNSHLQYVVTWYGLALTLVGVFTVFAHQRLAALDDNRREGTR